MERTEEQTKVLGQLLKVAGGRAKITAHLGPSLRRIHYSPYHWLGDRVCPTCLGASFICGAGNSPETWHLPDAPYTCQTCDIRWRYEQLALRKPRVRDNDWNEYEIPKELEQDFYTAGMAIHPCVGTTVEFNPEAYRIFHERFDGFMVKKTTLKITRK